MVGCDSDEAGCVCGEVVWIEAGFVPLIGEGVAKGKLFVERVGELEDFAEGLKCDTWNAAEYVPKGRPTMEIGWRGSLKPP